MNVKTRSLLRYILPAVRKVPKPSMGMDTPSAIS